jgi:hypothetical protein
MRKYFYLFVLEHRLIEKADIWMEVERFIE